MLLYLIQQELFHVGTQGYKVTRIDGIDHLTHLTVTFYHLP